MSGDQQTNQATTVVGQGPTAADAARSLLAACLATMLGEPARPGDQATVVRASAPTLNRLIPQYIAAMLVAGDDLGIELTDATLDGLIATDDGWRAWGTVSGEPASTPAVSDWRAGAATIEETGDATVMRLELRREPAGG